MNVCVVLSPILTSFCSHLIEKTWFNPSGFVGIHGFLNLRVHCTCGGPTVRAGSRFRVTYCLQLWWGYRLLPTNILQQRGVCGLRFLPAPHSDRYWPSAENLRILALQYPSDTKMSLVSGSTATSVGWQKCSLSLPGVKGSPRASRVLSLPSLLTFNTWWEHRGGRSSSPVLLY